MSIPIVPKEKSLVATRVTVRMLNFELNATEGSIEVTLTTESYTIIEKRSVYIPPEIYSQWAQSDDFIIDYALGQLGLQRDSTLGGSVEFPV